MPPINCTANWSHEKTVFTSLRAKLEGHERACGVPRILYTYSLESSRIKPRYQRFQSKGIRCSLAWFLNCSEHRFEERLQADYIETESAGPSFYMGGKLELQGSEIVSDEEDESDDEMLYRRTVSL